MLRTAVPSSRLAQCRNDAITSLLLLLLLLLVLLLVLLVGFVRSEMGGEHKKETIAYSCSTAVAASAFTRESPGQSCKSAYFRA